MPKAFVLYNCYSALIANKRLCLTVLNHGNEVLNALDRPLGRHTAEYRASAGCVVIRTSKGYKAVISAILRPHGVLKLTNTRIEYLNSVNASREKPDVVYILRLPERMRLNDKRAIGHQKR